MDLTPKSLADFSPLLSSTARQITANNSTNYPTPQSCADTEILSTRSPIISGLGILDGNSQLQIPHLPICSSSQPLLQSSQSWQSGYIPAQSYSAPHSFVATFPGMELYENLETMPEAANSP